MSIRRIAAFLLLCTSWGSEWMLTRDLELPPIQAVALRCAIAAVVLGCLAAIRRVSLPTCQLLLITAVMGGSMIALPAVLTIWASARMTPGLLIVVLAMTPLIAALLEGRASGSLLAPLVGGIAGTVVLASQGLTFSVAQLPGAIAAFTAATSAAASLIVIKRRLAPVDVMMNAGIQLAVAAALLAATAWIFERSEGAPWILRATVIEVSMAIVGSALAFPIYYWLLREFESYQLTASQWLVTAVGVVEGLVVVREVPSWRTVTGLGIGLFSLAMLLRSSPANEAPLTIQVTKPPTYC